MNFWKKIVEDFPRGIPGEYFEGIHGTSSDKIQGRFCTDVFREVYEGIPRIHFKKNPGGIFQGVPGSFFEHWIPGRIFEETLEWFLIASQKEVLKKFMEEIFGRSTKKMLEIIFQGSFLIFF